MRRGWVRALCVEDVARATTKECGHLQKLEKARRQVLPWGLRRNMDTTEPSPVRQQGDMERVCAFSKRRRAVLLPPLSLFSRVRLCATPWTMAC